MKTTNLFQLAALVFVAVSFVVVGDTAGKLLTGRGVDPIIVAWTRFGLAALLILPFSGLSASEFPNFYDWRVLVRAGFITVGICLDLSRFDAAPLIAFTATKEMNYGTNTD